MVLDNLKSYYRFLLDNHLDDLVTQNIQLLKNKDVPLLKYFAHLSDQEFFDLTKERLVLFMKGVLKDTAVEEAIATMDNWKKNQLQIIQKSQITSIDIVQVYSIRKQVFVNLLCTYTDDATTMTAIFKELEEFHSFIQRYAIDTLLDISNEELNKSIAQLEQSQHSLQVSNIVLQEHKEEMQTLNEELAATNEELSAANEELHSTNDELLKASEEQKAYISEIKAIQEELKLSRDYYLTLLEDFPCLIWRCNTEGFCNYFNNTWLTFRGKSLEKAYGDGWKEGIHPEDLEFCYNTFINSVKAQKHFELIYRVRRYDGEYRYIVDYGKPIYGINKEFTGFLGACFDITEQKQLSDALSVSNKQLQKANEELQKTQILLTESYNDLEEKVQERTKDLRKVKDEINTLLLSEKAANDEVNHQKKQLKVINSELKEKNEELLKINVDLDNFIYTASHDLKAPVTNIEGLMYLLNSLVKDKISDGDKKILGMMETSIQKFKKTILDLTEITKAQKGYDDALESLSLETVLEEVKADLEGMIMESEVTINENLEVKEIYYSPHNLRSIFYNLISNAIKYRSPERHPVIDISSTKENDFVILIFSDNGLGINESQKPKLFTMFKRFHTHVEGTGIGLYVIKRILENNKGKIELKDKEGGGSIFKVYIKQNLK